MSGDEPAQRGDGSSAQPEFSTLLSAAVTARGLSLARIRAALAERGLDVSVATLSYWTSGRSRPTRSRSLEVVRGLEQVLQVRPGSLVQAMGQAQRPLELGAVLGSDDLLREALLQGHLPRSDTFTILSQHLQVRVDDAGREVATETRSLQVAAQDGAQQWTTMVEHEAGCRVGGLAFGATQLRRVVPVHANLTGLVFGLDEPLERGTVFQSHHGIELGPGGLDVFTECGVAVRQAMPHLVLEIVFGERRPTTVRRCYRAPGEEVAVEVDAPVLRSGNAAQVVIAQAAPGLHQLWCEW